MATREERAGWRSRWVGCLYQFASLAFQRRLWVEGSIPNSMGSHTELICMYFDDCHLTEGYAWTISEGLLSPEEARAVERFHRAADAYNKDCDPDAVYLSDPAWQAVSSLASEGWRRLSRVAEAEVLAEMRRSEATWGAVEEGHA